MFDCEVDDYYQNKMQKSISGRNIVEEECSFVIAVLMAVTTAQNLFFLKKKDVKRNKIEKLDKKMFMKCL